jgi:hypothetical protein
MSDNTTRSGGTIMAARKTRKPLKLTARQREDEKQLDIEEKAFNRQLGQLLKKYKSQFVAVYKGKVVDHDADESVLFRRVINRLGDVVFLIAPVQREPRIYECPSLEAKW